MDIEVHVNSDGMGWVNSLTKAKQLRQEINFHSSIKKCFDSGDIDAVLEIGPGSALCSFISASLDNSEIILIPTIPNKKLIEKSS